MKGLEVKVRVPRHLRCPISLELMGDPVTLCTGLTYDRPSIETWLDAGNKVCPVTNQILQTQELIPNHTLRRIIQDWCVANSGRGVERIPTPKVPLNSVQISEIVAHVSAGDKEAVRKLRRLAKESDRNKKSIASSNASSVVASVFADHSPRAMSRFPQGLEMCEEALATLATILPVHDEALQLLASPASVACLVWLLHQGNPESKNNAVALLQELVSKNRYRDVIGGADGLAEGLVELVREPICPATTKASITTIYSISLRKIIRLKVVEAGVVPLLLEILVGPPSERGISERALLALDILCTCTEGRSAAYAHALAVPVLVKKILRVSDLASELAVSVLWNLCQNSSDGGAVLEALQVGAFQKLLVLVQLGCGERTRERASLLLKLFNTFRDHEWECRDTLEFNNVKRSF